MERIAGGPQLSSRFLSGIQVWRRAGPAQASPHKHPPSQRVSVGCAQETTECKPCVLIARARGRPGLWAFRRHRPCGPLASSVKTSCLGREIRWLQRHLQPRRARMAAASSRTGLAGN
jgi:hypothetical protein